MSELDKSDIDILRHLQQDGRLSNASLASRIALSETPCWRRLRKMEENGYITDYQANIDRRKLGFGVMAFVQLSCTEHDEASTLKFEQAIEQSPNVLACHNTTGESDFILQVVARDLDDYSHFIEQVLRKLPGISAIRSNISLREIKASSRLPI